MAVKKNNVSEDVFGFADTFASFSVVEQLNLLAYALNNFKDRMSPELHGYLDSLYGDRLDVAAEEHDMFLVGLGDISDKKAGYGLTELERVNIGCDGFAVLKEAGQMRAKENVEREKKLDIIGSFLDREDVLGRVPELLPVRALSVEHVFGDNGKFKFKYRNVDFRRGIDFDVPSVPGFQGLKVGYDSSEFTKTNCRGIYFAVFSMPQVCYDNASYVPLFELKLREVESIRDALYGNLKLERGSMKRRGRAL